MSVKGVISISDNATAVFRQLRKEQSAFKKEVESTKKEMVRTWDKKYTAKINATPAMATIKSLTKSMQPLRQKIVTALAAKDAATAKIAATTNKLKVLGSKVASPIIKAKDAATSTITKVATHLKGIATGIAIPISIVGGAAIAGTLMALSGGMKLETQQISMQHFIDINNKGMDEATLQKMSQDYIAELRKNANSTPFETEEVMSAGTRAVGLTGGDTAAAMELVRIAEDMAALTPGKTVGQAMEALADAKNGEMERLKEFNAKVTADEFEKLGFQGIVEQKLKAQFEGGSAKLAESSSGLISTIKGSIKSQFSDFGLVAMEKLKPTLKGIIGIIEAAAPAITNLGIAFANNLGTGIEWLTSKIIKAVPIISTLIGFISGAITTVVPVVMMIFGAMGEKIGGVIDFISSKMSFLSELITWAAPLISDILSTSWTVISPLMDLTISAFELLANCVQRVFPVIQTVIDSCWQFIKPIIECISAGVTAAANAVSWAAQNLGFGSSGGGTDIGQNANGTNNWRGGATWVGEKGPELIDLPRGSRVLPNKESLRFASNGKCGGNTFTIAKLADTIIVREEADIDKIGDSLVRKLKLATENI
ncbi:MAG: hypothetical protein RR846_09650 [Oscillospiraceae bacterium]